MVSLSSVSGCGGALYLEIRRIELRGEPTKPCYEITGVVGDGCDEALIRIVLGAVARVEIIPFCNDDGSGVTLEQKVPLAELTRLVLEALNQVYFCVDAVPDRRRSGRISAYADRGRLFQLREARPGPHQQTLLAESPPRWQAA